MIELRGVSKTVPAADGPLTILHPLDLSVPAGRLTAVVGPSGSGKSTLLGLVAGLDAPTTGTVVLDGVDVTALDEDRLAALRGEKIGFVFQFFHLIPSLTALENVAVPMEIAGRHEAEARARALLGEVGLAERASHYPTQLSGGEQQRVAIARALANDPKVLLADEPTGNLDADSARHVIELLTGAVARRGTTAVLVTHDLELARLADLVVRLRGGRVESVTPRASAAP
jgi:putative ABC transport system ATP-binding protein